MYWLNVPFFSLIYKEKHLAGNIQIKEYRIVPQWRMRSFKKKFNWGAYCMYFSLSFTIFFPVRIHLSSQIQWINKLPICKELIKVRLYLHNVALNFHLFSLLNNCRFDMTLLLSDRTISLLKIILKCLENLKLCSSERFSIFKSIL